MATKHISMLQIWTLLALSSLSCKKDENGPGFRDSGNRQDSASSAQDSLNGDMQQDSPGGVVESPGVHFDPTAPDAATSATATEANDNNNNSTSTTPPTKAPPKIDNLKTFLAVSDEEALHELKTGEEQIAIVCARNVGKVNKFITAFCTNKARPKSLVELQTVLGLGFPATPQPGRGNNGATGNGPGFAIQGHSSSLVGRFVTSINPRVILFDSSGANDIALGFVRGEQLSEIAVKNTDNSFDFFIVGFEQACNKSPQKCTPGDLLTPAVEKNWTNFTIYQDEDLKNTIVDCRECHQPAGPGTQKILRMQELVNPWTHWFRDNTAGQGLIADYQAAHGTTEAYGGIPATMISGSDPAKLENFIRANGFVDPTITTTNRANSQPNQFDTAGIAAQVAATARANVAFLDPVACKVSLTANSPSKSVTWDGILYNFMNRTNACLLAGQANGTVTMKTNLAYIPPPYHGLRVTEPAKLAVYTKQYQDFLAGTVTTKDFKDHRDVLISDPKNLAEAGFGVDPAMSPAETLKVACSQCHHSQLDQALSRAKFNAVDIDKMADRNAELDIAIARVKLGLSPERLKAEGMKIFNVQGVEVEMHKAENVLTMPPRRFRVLSDAQIDSLVAYLNSLKK